MTKRDLAFALHNKSSYSHTVRTIPTNSGVLRHRVAHPSPSPSTSGSPRHRITAISSVVTRSVSHPYEGKRTPNTVRRAEGKSESKRVGQKVRAVAQPYRVKIATWDQPEPALAALARELLGLPGQAALRHWPRLRRGPCRCCRLARARRHQALEARASFYEEGAGR